LEGLELDINELFRN